MDEAPHMRAERVGVVATDPLRVLGLKSIFSETMQFEIVHLSVPGALDDAHLSLVLIDAECARSSLRAHRHLPPDASAAQAHRRRQRDRQEYIQRVIGAGAKGYLAITSTEAEIRMAIDMVRDGSVWAPRKVLSRLLDNQRSAARSPADPPKFTPRELEVLTLLRAGQPNREIASALGIDEGTVKAHIGRLMRKVGVNNRIALTVHPYTQLQ